MTWEVKRLGDVCDIVNGGTPDTKVKEYWDGENLWITPKDMGKLNNIFVDETERKITDSGLKNSSAKLLPINSIILSSRAPIGHLAINKKPISTNQGCKGIIPKNVLDFLFLYYFLKKSVELLNSLGSGTTFKELSGSKLAEVIIPLPPLPEQKRIVAILDSAFENIARAKESAEKNLKNANEIFESYLQSVFENKGDGWEEKNLGSICSLITKGSSPKWQGIKYVEEPGVLFITSENVGEYQLILENRKFVEDKFNLKDKKSILQKGDILTNIVGASIGRTAMYTLDDVANINQAVCILRCKPEFISNFYLMNLLNSAFMKKILHKNEVNNARANLSLTFFSNLSVSLPPLSKQQSIVSKLDALSTETKKLEAIYQKKLADLEELKKSILAKAFNGELTEASA
jgi:type I restriction enzyme S subunit